jgi:hypothetical protein
MPRQLTARGDMHARLLCTRTTDKVMVVFRFNPDGYKTAEVKLTVAARGGAGQARAGRDAHSGHAKDFCVLSLLFPCQPADRAAHCSRVCGEHGGRPVNACELATRVCTAGASPGCPCARCRCLGGRSMGGRCLGGRCLGGRCLGGRCLGGRCLGGRCLDGRCLGGRCLGGRCLDMICCVDTLTKVRGFHPKPGGQHDLFA